MESYLAEEAEEAWTTAGKNELVQLQASMNLTPSGWKIRQRHQCCCYLLSKLLPPFR
jgi:hypothetical protein